MQTTTASAPQTTATAKPVDSSLTDYVAGFVTAHAGARHSERCGASGQALGARWHWTRTRGRRVANGRHRPPLSRAIRHRHGQRQHHYRQRAASARAFRSVRQRARDSRRRLRRHATRRRKGPRVRLAYASDRTSIAAGTRIGRARPAQRSGSDARLSNRRRSRMQGRRGDSAAALSARFSQHRDVRVDRRRRRAPRNFSASIARPRGVRSASAQRRQADCAKTSAR